MRHDPLIPMIGVVTKIRVDTPDVKTFRVVGLDGRKPFEHIPGQCAMLSIPGVGEALFSITSSPTEADYVEFSIKKCGCVTDWLHSMDEGQQITIRGPYGNGFPVDSAFAASALPRCTRSSITAATTAAATARSTLSTAHAPRRIWSIIRRSSMRGAGRTASVSI